MVLPLTFALRAVVDDLKMGYDCGYTVYSERAKLASRLQGSISWREILDYQRMRDALLTGNTTSFERLGRVLGMFVGNHTSFRPTKKQLGDFDFRVKRQNDSTKSLSDRTH